MLDENRLVICGANAYDKKYYFNQLFKGLPQSIQDELHIICVLFTEEIGGIFTIAYEPNGDIELLTDADENDVLYDEIGSGLLVGEIRRNKQELFEALKMYFRAFVLKEDAEALLEEIEE